MAIFGVVVGVAGGCWRGWQPEVTGRRGLTQDGRRVLTRSLKSVGRLLQGVVDGMRPLVRETATLLVCLENYKDLPNFFDVCLAADWTRRMNGSGTSSCEWITRQSSHFEWINSECVLFSVKNQKEKKFRDKISRQMALLDSVDRWRWQRRKETGPPANELGPTISQWRTLLLVTQVRLTKYGTCCLHFLRFQSETQSHLAEPPVPPARWKAPNTFRRIKS